MLLRYQAEKGLEEYRDDDLMSYVRSYDQHFSYAGIPTVRINEVYLEAMREHGAYLLRVDDYLRAWDRIKPKEGDGADVRAMGERGIHCSICGGRGYTVIFVPHDFREPDGLGEERHVPCPYHCRQELMRV